MAGIGIICAVSAPSSLAVQAAIEFGIGLAGFVRDGSYNVYSHPERFDLDS
jgi:FdhD protein